MLAIGLVETLGLVGSIEAADAMLKAADVQLLELALADAGLCTIVVCGEVSACQAAVDAGKASIERVFGGKLWSAIVIPRPDEQLEEILRLYPEAKGSISPFVQAPAEESPREAAKEPAKVEAEAETRTGSSEREPDAGVSSTLGTAQTDNALNGEAAPAAPAGGYSEAALKSMSLGRLREIARGMALSMTNGSVSTAGKKALIAAILSNAGKREE